MGILSFLSKSAQPAPNLLRLPAGSFTVDRSGRLVASTLPQDFPEEKTREIAQTVLLGFRQAQAAGLVLGELVVEYSTLKLTARELRGGAIIFLAPRSLNRK